MIVLIYKNCQICKWLAGNMCLRYRIVVVFREAIYHFAHQEKNWHEGSNCTSATSMPVTGVVFFKSAGGWKNQGVAFCQG